MQRLSRAPYVDTLSDSESQKVIKKRDSDLYKTSLWKELHDIFIKDACVDGEFGYQKTNNDVINWPIIYITEIHVFASQTTEKPHYKLVMFAVQIDEKNKKPLIDKAAEYIIKESDNLAEWQDMMSTTKTFESGVVIQYGGWYNLDDVIKARNDKLVEQGKFTQEQIDEMIKKDGYVHAMRTHRLVHKT